MLPKSISISDKFSVEFQRVAENATETYIAVGMITEKMFSFAERKLAKSNVFRIILGIHMPTPPQVMKKLSDLEAEGRLNVKIFTEKFFHSKMYLFNLTGQWVAFVGSGNFTNGGWHSNEELFVRITDQENCQELFEKFKHWENKSQSITPDFIRLYSENFEKNAPLEEQKKKNIGDLADKLNSNFNIDNIDFSVQFFKKSDYMAFEPTKTSLDTKEIWEERAAVRNKLYKLNALVTPQLPKSWNIHPHYVQEYIASQIETVHHEQQNVRSLWVGYGRDEKSLKMYGDVNTTPLYFMRMQVIIHHSSVGFWLMPGKADAGKVDRGNIIEKMRNKDYSTRFFELLTGLGEHYWIEIANDKRNVIAFRNVDDLEEYVKRDAIRHYFTIGRDYSIDDPKLSINNIVHTCLTEFTKYYALYNLILHKL